MKTNFKTKQKQLKQLLGEDFDNILIRLITKSKVKDESIEIGDVDTDNEHFLKDVLERLVEGCYIDGIKIPFTDYEIKMSGWVDRVNERFIPPNSIPKSSKTNWPPNSTELVG